jgi:hypothetical protein
MIIITVRMMRMMLIIIVGGVEGHSIVVRSSPPIPVLPPPTLTHSCTYDPSNFLVTRLSSNLNEA